jgi:hypothetical protein
MKEKPILFNTPMVMAVLEGRKTMTRRVINHIPGVGKVVNFEESATPGYKWQFQDKKLRWHDVKEIKSFFEPGDILWVRETWNSLELPNTGITYSYKADGEISPYPWKPSIFMPREAARLFLEVKSVRIERLRDITEADAKLEGARIDCTVAMNDVSCDMACMSKPQRPCMVNNRKANFVVLWDRLNARRVDAEKKPVYSWESNPLVWVCEFRRIEK